MRHVIIGVLLSLLATNSASSQTLELDRIQLSVIVSPRTQEAMGSEAAALRRAVETALAARGMGSVLPDQPTRFIAYVELVPLQEEMVSGGMTALKEQLSITFGDRAGGKAMGSFVTEARAVGKSKEGALRNLSTSLNLTRNNEWNATIEAANLGVIRFFEQQCSSLLREIDAKIQQRQFEDAMYLASTVPREAPNCHKNALDGAGRAYSAMLRHQCAVPFAQAKAKWSASKSRESAMLVAELLGAIAADSPCFSEAAAVADDVANAMAATDAVAARERREQLALQRKVYEDRLALEKDQTNREFLLQSQLIESARQVGIERARAYARTGGANASQSVVFR